MVGDNYVDKRFYLRFRVTMIYVFSFMNEDETSVLLRLIIWQLFKIKIKRNIKNNWQLVNEWITNNSWQMIRRM